MVILVICAPYGDPADPVLPSRSQRVRDQNWTIEGCVGEIVVSYLQENVFTIFKFRESICP